MPLVPPLPDDTAVAAPNHKRLLLLAWASTLLPLIAFTYLTWQSYQMSQAAAAARAQVNAARAELQDLAAQKTAVEQQLVHIRAAFAQEIEQQRESTKHYRDVAGVRIQFYRESDRHTVEKALETLGFRVDTRLGSATLINRSPNTIAYGATVSSQDLRDVAVALVRAGFPLKRITKAMVQPDPKLIQIFASAQSDRDCGPLTEDQIRAELTCGPK